MIVVAVSGTMTSLRRELAAHPGAIVAWEVDGANLSVFSISAGATQLALTAVEPDQRASLKAELSRLGHVQGHYASGTGLVWRREADAFTVWNARARVFRADASALAFARQTVARDAAGGLEIVAFVDEDFVNRGVRACLATGEHTVALHRQLRATADWSYGALDALADSTWTVILGRDLADFLGAPFVDETPA